MGGCPPSGEWGGGTHPFDRAGRADDRILPAGNRLDVGAGAQRNPAQYRDLIVGVAGYSDYFCDLTTVLQDEIIARTGHTLF